MDNYLKKKHTTENIRIGASFTAVKNSGPAKNI